MVETIDAFIKSDNGFILGIALFGMGLADLFSAWFLTKVRPEMLPLSDEVKARLFPILFFVTSFMLLLGGYMISFHL